MVKKFRKKPVVIETIQYLGAENEEEVIRFADSEERPVKWSLEDGLIITTLEGSHRADVGDYIIKGVQGECYPCKPDIFDETYEEVTYEPNS